jgi:dimethylaniline monooxygenase (N-oxide forming)
VVHPDVPGLYFVGLVQPLGAIMPLAEAQAEWVADLVSGVAALPSREEMLAEVRAYDERVARRYVASKRHTIQVDVHAYLTELRRERRAAADRVVGRPLRPVSRLRGRLARSGPGS